jgi:hypothetical protein
MKTLPADACGNSAGGVSDGFPVGGLCRTGTPFLQNITFMPKALNTPTFDPSSLADGEITSIIPTSDNQFIILGNFSTYQDEPRNGIARINSDASLDTKFNTPELMNGSSITVIPQTDGKFIIIEYSTIIRDSDFAINRIKNNTIK